MTKDTRTQEEQIAEITRILRKVKPEATSKVLSWITGIEAGQDYWSRQPAATILEFPQQPATGPVRDCKDR